jgi:hypothetical protein
MNEHDEAITQLIATADPLHPVDDQPALDRAWTTINDEVIASPVAVPLRRRWRRPVAVIGAVAIALAASAAAVVISTRTGTENPAAEVPLSGPGEVWRLDGTDFASQLATISADIPFPDQASRKIAITRLADEAAGAGGDAQTTTGTVRGTLAKEAICAWATTWNDTDSRATATSALRGALTWTAVTDLDPSPSIDGYAGDDGSQPTVFGYLPGIVRAATKGDRTRFAHAVDGSGWCGTRTPPEAPQPDPSRDATTKPAPTSRP